MVYDSLHTYYATTNALKDSLTRYVGIEKLNDTLNAYFDSTKVKSAIHDTADVLRSMMTDAANDAKITIQKNGEDVGDFTVNQAADKTINIPVPTTVAEMTDASDYVKTTKLNDTLEHYLQAGALCDSLVKCEVVQNMRDSIRTNATAITALRDADAALSTRIQNDSANLVDFKTKVKADSITLATRIVTDSTALHNALKDTASAIRGALGDTATAIRNSIGNGTLTIKQGTIELGSFTANQMGNSSITIPTPAEQAQSDWNENNSSDPAYIQSKPNIRDSVNRVVLDSLSAVNSAMNRAVDTIARNNIHDSLDVVRTKIHTDSLDLVNRIVTDSTALADKMHADSLTLANRIVTDSTALVNRIVADSNALAHRMDTLLNHVCDSVQECVTGWISDSTRMVYDSLHTYYVNTNTLRDTAAAIRGDIPDVSGFATKDELRADSTVLANRIVTDSTVLANRIVTDSTVLVNRIVTDSTALHNALKDTASAIRADFPEVSDKTITVKQGDNTIGTFTLNQGTDGTVIIPTPAEQAQSDWNENNSSDPAYIQNKPNIRDSVNRVVLDSLSAANSAMNRAVDTISRNNIHDSLDVIRTKIHTDSLDLVNRIVTDSTVLADKMHADSLTLANRIVTDSTALVNRIVADSNALAHRMDTLLNHVCDSVQECVTGWISDSTRMVYDSLHTYYATTNALRDTAAAIRGDIPDVSGFATKDELRADSTVLANRIVTDSTVLANRIVTDSTALVNRIVTDSLALVNRIVTDSTALHNALTDTASAIRGALGDTATAIRNSIGNGTLTIVQGTTELGTFTANQMGNSSITIPTPAEQAQSDWKENNASDPAYIRNKPNIRDSVNRVVLDSLSAANSAMNRAVDTIVRNNIHDSLDVIRTKIHTDSLDLVNRIVTDSTALHKAIKDTAAAIRNDICDSATVCITKALADPTSEINHAVDTIARNNIHDTAEVLRSQMPVVNDGQLSISVNGGTAQTFTANQSGNTEVNISVPTCDDLANCDLIQDILSRLERLEYLNDSLAREIDKMKPALTVTGPEETTVCFGSSKPVTYTATFHNCSSSDYTLAWKVNGVDSSNVTASKLIVNVETAGQYEVVCIATRSDNTTVSDTVTTTVTVDNNIPHFIATANNLTVTLSEMVYTDTIQWDTDSVPVPFSGTAAEHTYAVADTITITATSEGGCTYVYGLRLQAMAPAVTTVSIPDETITATTAIANGTVTFDGGIPSTKRGMVFSSTNEHPELGAEGVDSVMNGTGMGDFACNLKRLVPCTQYYVCAFAFNDVDTVYGEVKTFTTPSFTCGNTLTDIDGNEYATLLLGSQCWMKQNLRTTHYADGTEIALGNTSSDFNSPFRYAPGSESAEVLNAYGYLYNWAATMHGGTSSSANPSGVQGVCPDGWHLPSDAEWTQLTNFVASDNANVCGGNPAYIAKALASKEMWGNWGSCSVNCLMCTDPSSNNSTGFSALPSGTWNSDGAVGHGTSGYTNYGHTIFRSATEYENSYAAWVREFYNEYAYVGRTAIAKTTGLPVRCVLDCATGNSYKPTVSAVTFTDTVGTAISMSASVSSDPHCRQRHGHR